MTCLECSPVGFFFTPWKIGIFLGLFLIAFYFIKKIRNSKEINKKIKYIYMHLFFLISPIVFFIFFNGCKSIYSNCSKPSVILAIIGISAVVSLLFVLMIAPVLILKYYKKKSISIENKRLLSLVRKYSNLLGIKEPRLFILDTAKPKAFSFSYFFNAVFISIGIIEILTFNELKAVILHELSHIKQRSPLLKFSSFLLRVSSPMAGFSSLNKELDNHEDYADKLAIRLQGTEKHIAGAKRKVRSYKQ